MWHSPQAALSVGHPEAFGCSKVESQLQGVDMGAAHVACPALKPLADLQLRTLSLLLAPPSCACSIKHCSLSGQAEDFTCFLLQGLVSKETIRGIYDGTWFYQQADKIEAEKAKKATTNGRNGHKD